MTRAEPTPRDERAERPGRSWALLASIGVLLIASLLPLGAVVDGADWWVTAVLAITAVLVPAGAVSAFGGAPWVGTLVGVGVWLLGIVVVFAPETAVLGVVPTPDTVAAFQQLSVEAGRSLYVQSVPVDPVTPLLFLLAVGVGAVAVLAHVVGVSLRSPGLTGILAVGLLVPPSIFTGDIDLVAYVIVGIAFLVVLRMDGRRAPAGLSAASSRSSALALGAAAVAVTVIAATLAPTFSSRSLVQPDGESAFGSGVSQLADLGRDLQRPGNTPHFSYQTTATTPQYLRLLTLDRFEGAQWTASGEHASVEQQDGERLSVPGLGDGVVAEEQTVNVQITGLVGDLLPVPFPSVAIDGLRGEWEWDADGLTVSTSSSSVEDQEYTVTSLLVQPTADQLRDAPADYPSSVSPFLELPDDIPATLQSVFDEVTDGTTTGYDAAFAIQQYLRTEFSYSVATPVREGYDGDGFQAIADFLDAGSGYCVHFASAMAILTRMAGIPSRVSLGYLPGDRVGSDDDGFVGYRVGSDDLHAWPELYFAGVGWVPFEPTPGRGTVPSYAAEESATPDAEDTPSGAPSRTPTATPTPTGSVAPDASTTEGTRDTSAGRTTTAGLVLLLLVIVIVLLPAGVRIRRRRARIAASGVQSSVLPLWDDLVDSVTDLGSPVGDGDSERDLADRLRRALPEESVARDALQRLLRATEAERYAGGARRAEAGTVAGARSDASIVSRELGATVSRGRRLRAILAPTSVLSPRAAARARANVA